MASQQSSTSSSVSSGFSGINDPKALEALQTLIEQLQSGGTDAMKSQAASKKAGIDQINAALGDYKKSAAFQDALDLVTASLDKALLAQKPAITRAVHGAGTSASSMQGLLAQNAAEAASTQAGALGAEQAKSYGQITASLLNTLVNATNSSDPAVTELLKALDLTRVSQQNSTSVSQSQGSSTDPVQQQQQSSGGGGRAVSTGGGGAGTGNTTGGGLFDGYNSNSSVYQPANDGFSFSSSERDLYGTPGGVGFADTISWDAVDSSPSSNVDRSNESSYDWGNISFSGSPEWSNPYISSSSDVYQAPEYDWNSIPSSSGTDEWYNPYL